MDDGTRATIAAIDCHAHVMRRDLPLASERHSAPKRDVSVEEYVAVLDAHAISHGVLTAPSFYGTDNHLLLSALDAFPTRLRGTVIVDPGIDEVALADMGRRGVVGVRLNWVRRATLPDVTSPAYRALFAKVRELGWHVEIFLEGPKLADVLPRIRESGVNVVVDHFGSPDPALGVADAGFRAALKGIAAGDTWIKLSAPYRLGGVDAQRYVDALLDAGARPAGVGERLAVRIARGGCDVRSVRAMAALMGARRADPSYDPGRHTGCAIRFRSHARWCAPPDNRMTRKRPCNHCFAPT